MNINDLKNKIPYQWRVQSFGPNTAACVAYIDSRDVQELLDTVVGPANWQCDYKEIKGNLFCGIAIRMDDQWVWKWDCGIESNTEKEKGEASDSFKRAAVKWGVGRFLYDLDIVRLAFIEMERGGKKYKYPVDDSNNIIYDGSALTAFINNRQNKIPTHQKKPTSSYGHVELEKNGLPLISNVQYKKLMERVRGGDTMAGVKALAAFSFDETQLKNLNQELQKEKV